MKRTKEQKGITLIALIITIVVLMVLASVAISSIQNDGIIGHAENAKNKFTEEQQKEQDMLNYYELVLSGKAWTQNGTKVTRGDVTLEVGDEIAIVTGENTSTPYAANNVNEWRVLGVEYGKLLLVSAENVASEVGLGGAKEGDVDGCIGGYYDGVAALDEICSVYKNGTYADSARSIRVEDINRVTGYDPTKDTNYGKTYKYTTSGFVHPDGREIGKNGGESIEVTNTAYRYEPTSIVRNSSTKSFI